MAIIFIGAYIVLAILVYIMFTILKRNVNKLDEQSKTYYLDKLQEYDEIINEREKKINRLNKEIENKKVEIESIKNANLIENKEFDISIIDSIAKADYKEDSLFELEKIVNNNWNYDNEKIVEKFVEKTKDSTLNYEFCKNIKRKFNSQKIYEFKIMSEEKLNKKLNELLDEKEMKLLESFKKTHDKFTIDEFVLFLGELINLNNPEIVVLTGNHAENFDYISKNVKTKYDDSIYRGIKIVYQGKVYDFSLNGRNL